MSDLRQFNRTLGLRSIPHSVQSNLQVNITGLVNQKHFTPCIASVALDVLVAKGAELVVHGIGHGTIRPCGKVLLQQWAVRVLLVLRRNEVQDLLQLHRTDVDLVTERPAQDVVRNHC